MSSHKCLKLILLLFKKRPSIILFSSPLCFVLSIFPNEHMGIIFLYYLYETHTHTQYSHVFLCHIGDIFSVTIDCRNIIIHSYFFLFAHGYLNNQLQNWYLQPKQIKKTRVALQADHRKTLQPFKFNKSACCIYFCYGKQVLHYGH